MSATQDLGIYQIGRETTKGTPVATTNRLISRELIVTPVEPVFQPQAQLGVLLENPTSDTLAVRSAEVKFSGDLTFEQILYPLNMCMKGVTSASATSGAQLWDFNPTYTADPACHAFSLQRRLSDGVTNWDEGISYVMGTDFSIAGAIGQNATFECNAFGRPIDTAVALTGAIAVPTVNFVSTAMFKVYIDDTFASLGATQVSASIYDFAFKFRSQSLPKFYVDGRTDKSFTQHALKRAGFDLELGAEWTTAINSERAKAASRAIRYVRLSAIGGTAGSTVYTLNIDLALRYEQGQFDKETEREGNDASKLKFVGAYDSAAPLAAKLRVINMLATLP